MGMFDTVIEKGKALANSAFDNALSAIMPTQGSDWQGLSNQLIARFYAVKAVGNGENRRYLQDLSQGLPVHAPILEGAEIEYQFNWQSPFEQMGTEAKAPALSAMLQSGAISDVYSAFMARFSGDNAAASGGDKSAVGSTLKELEGRTGITKLNSTQTFAGMPPVKCSLKLLFRAYQNPQLEVMNPITQLIKWAMPIELSQNGAIVNLLDPNNEKNFIDALMPSKAPTLIAMEYKGRIYKPMVIEAISDPITSPTTRDGSYAKAEVSLTLASLSAWDRADIAQIYK